MCLNLPIVLQLRAIPTITTGFALDSAIRLKGGNGQISYILLVYISNRQVALRVQSFLRSLANCCDIPKS